MRRIPTLCLLLAVACSHAPARPPPGDIPALPPQRPNSAYEQRVREVLSERRDELRACDAQARGKGTVAVVLTSSPLYVSPGLAYLPRKSRVPFLNAFERCVLERLPPETLPAQVGDYSGVWVRIHFVPEGGPAPSATASPLYTHAGLQASLEVTSATPDRVTLATPEPGTVPDPARDVLDYSEELGRVEELSGNKIQFTQAAFDDRVEGTMGVKCLLTWQGTLEDCRIVKPLPHLEQAVLVPLLSKRYTPLTFEGTPVNVDYLFTIQFRFPR